MFGLNPQPHTWSLSNEALSLLKFKRVTQVFLQTNKSISRLYTHPQSLLQTQCSFCKMYITEESRRFDVFIFVNLPHDQTSKLFAFITVDVM